MTGWDGHERRSDDLTGRVAALEAYSKTQNVTLRDLKYDLTKVREGVSEIRRDIHGARIGGRVALAIAMALGGLIAWVIRAGLIEKH